MDPKEFFDRLDKRLDRIEQKQDELKEVSVRQEENVREHMRRTELLEQQIVPLTKAAAMWAGAGKVLTVLGALTGVTYSVIKIVEALRGF